MGIIRVGQLLDDPSIKFDDRAFRRGFIHGYLMALDNIKAGIGYNEMNSFFNDQLMPWRESDCSVMASPPEIEEKL